MRPGQASRTAQWVAFARGLGPFHAVPLVEDPLAVELLGGQLAGLLRLAGTFPALTRLVVRAGDALTGGRTRFMCYRTRFLDDEVRRASEAGVSQLVLLGAGLDARAWRLGAPVAGVTVFEVDHPDTQSLKRARLGAKPPHAAEVRFVGVDFAVDALDARLHAAGFDPSLPALVIWEGVVMYLEPTAIDATLNTLRGLLAPGSRVAISYSRTGSGSGTLLRRVVGVVVAAAGERFRHHEEPPEMQARLARAGFDVVTDEGHPDWVPRHEPRTTTWDIQRIVVASPQ